MPRLKEGRGRKRDFPPKKSRCSQKLGIRFGVSGFLSCKIVQQQIVKDAPLNKILKLVLLYTNGLDV